MNNYTNLDLDIIKEKICDYAYIDEAKSFIMNQQVDFNPLVIKKNLNECREALNILKENNTINFDGIHNIISLLDKADKDITLSGIELKNILVFHNHCNRLKKQFQNIEGLEYISDYTDSISINDHIFDKVTDSIENSGEIKKEASEKLSSLIDQIERCEKDLYNKAHSFLDKNQSSLQESNIFIRENRLVFLIKNSDKNRFGGYTYGSSSSGLAFYVEPSSFIELNNKKINLLNDKDDEINRILTELTYLISSVSDSYRNNFESLTKLCVVFAKANYGFYNNGIIAEISNNYYFDFKDLGHPLIDPRKLVTNSYRLYEPYKGIVISGSNTGGKTVSLKAIGLSIIMSYLGIPIIATEAMIPIYKNIFIDIDDNQSIQDSLSTFSAHISNINDILNNADDKSLILIDELISGTDPKQAQAISLAILDKIKELGSIFIITTHFDDIKNYSYDDEQILLSSVGFNMETLSPTYRYLEDSVGSSNALEIASRYFDDQQLIDSAKKYLDKNKTQQDELLDRLSKEIDEYQLLKDKLNETLLANEQLNKDLQYRLKEFDQKKEKLKKRYLTELDEYVNNIKLKADELLDNIKSRKDDDVVKQIDDLLDSQIENDEPTQFEEGDNVRIKDNEQIGRIISIKDNIASIDIRGLTVKTDIKELTLMPKTSNKKPTVESTRYKRVKSELNLVGERIEDALPVMEEYIDKAYASHMSNVKIIHGIGTGALRTAIRQRLNKISSVKSYKDGDFYDGGSAVTMVELKT